MKVPQKKKDEPNSWLDDPSNRQKLRKGLYWLCGLVILADLIFSIGWHKHAVFKEDASLHTVETLPAFYGIYGLLACVALVFLPKFLRNWNGKKMLMREENYWDK